MRSDKPIWTLTCDGPLGTKLTCGDRDLIRELSVTSIDFHKDVTVWPQLTLRTEFQGYIETDKPPRVEMRHPITREWAEVKRIEFADGSSWTAEDGPVGFV